jgi:hypothetical protein
MKFLIFQKLIVVLFFNVWQELVAVLFYFLLLLVLFRSWCIHYVRKGHHVYLDIFMVQNLSG